jgi:hypothetical protein
MQQGVAKVLSASMVVVLSGLCHGQVVQDGGFEAGTPNAFWTEMSTNFGTPICDGACLGGLTGARTGQWWAWFGGIDTAFEQGSIAQTVNIPTGSPTLEFYLVGYADPGNPAVDFMKVFLGSTEVFSIDDEDLQDPLSPYTFDYALVSIDLTPFAGTTQQLRFESTTNGAGFLTNFWIDDVEIAGGGGPGGCYANCDGSTTPPVLNVADFTCFLTKFAAGDPYANCDGSTTPPVLNVADFTCFLTKFAAGC